MVLYVNLKRKRQWIFAGERPMATQKHDLSVKKKFLSVSWNISVIMQHEDHPPVRP